MECLYKDATRSLQRKAAMSPGAAVSGVCWAYVEESLSVSRARERASRGTFHCIFAQE